MIVTVTGGAGYVGAMLARELLGWEPTVELREGLQRTLEASGTDALTGVAPA